MIFCAAHRQYGHDFKSRVLQLKPKLYFDLNEASGSTLVNRGYLGTGFNATVTGTPTAYQAAPLVKDHGGAMTFSGTPNYAATVGSATIGDALGVHTVGCWAKWTTTTSLQTLMSLRSTAGVTTQAPIVVMANQPTAGKITLFAFNTSATVVTSGTYNDGNPHLVMCAINAAGTNGTLWVDGVLIGSAAVGTRASANLAFGIAANILNSSSGQQFFPSTVDEAFFIPSLPTTDAMALALYNAGIR